MRRSPIWHRSAPNYYTRIEQGRIQVSERVGPPLQRLLDDLAATLAIVMGRRLDVLAWDRLAAAMITDFGQVPANHRNYLRILFTDPAMRTLYKDWESVAKTAVAQLRMEAGQVPRRPRWRRWSAS